MPRRALDDRPCADRCTPSPGRARGSVSNLPQQAREVAAAFERTSGNKVTVIQEAGPALEQRLRANGPAGLIASNPASLGGLAKKGWGGGGGHQATPFVLAGLGLSVRAGAPKPDIATVEDYKALLAAKSIGYSHGC